jgi:hypothetical protein
MGRRAVRLLALILAAACASGRIPPPVRAADPGAKLVAVYWEGPNPAAWRRSPWYRVESDVVTPLRIVIANDGFACLLEPGTDEPRRGEYFVCPIAWRAPRGVP